VLRPRDEVFSMTWRPEDETNPKTGRPYDQVTLGHDLAGDEYHLRSREQLTSCTTCHR
jgi:hypothetical protein